MKKALLLSMLTLSSFVVTHAQSSWIGGGISYSHQNSEFDPKTDYDDESKTTDLKNAISIFTFYCHDINEKWAYGLNLGISYSKVNHETTNQDFTENKSNIKLQNYSFSPYLRRYWTLSDKFRFFTSLAASYKYNKEESESKQYIIYYSDNESHVNAINTVISEYNTIGLALIPGIEYRLNDRIAIQSTIGSLHYALSWKGGQDKYNKHDVNLDLTSSISLSLMVRIGD